MKLIAARGVGWGDKMTFTVAPAEGSEAHMALGGRHPQS